MRNHIGKAIREKRLEFHMTQDELAKRLNVTRDAVGKWENQINSVHSDYLPEIANILGTSIDELFAYEGGKAKIRQDIQCEESMIDAAEDNDTEKILVVSNDFVHEAPEEFKDRIKYGYFSLSDEDYESCEMNPCAIPEGVSPQRWAEILIEEICSAYKIKNFVCLDGFQINELLSHKITYMNSNGLNKRSVKFIVGLARAWCDETGRSIIVMTKEEYAEYSSRA